MMRYYILIWTIGLVLLASCTKIKQGAGLPSIENEQVTELTAAQKAWVEQIAKEKRDSMRIVDSLIAIGQVVDTTSLLHRTGLLVALVEVNDHYFPNVLAFLDEENKPVIDLAFPFSANININPNTGKPYVYYNPEHQAMIRLGVYRQVQNGGVPVGLSLLGNHDAAGWSNFESLADATAFAQQVAFEVRQKGYVAVFADDEYSNYNSNADPNSFLMAMSEIKRLLPDIYLCWFAFGGGFGTWNGKKMGDIADACFPNYGLGIDYGTVYNFKKKGCFVSYNGYAPGYDLSKSVRDQGYGGVMIFNMAGNNPHLLDDCVRGLKGKEVHVPPGALNPQEYDFINGR